MDYKAAAGRSISSPAYTKYNNLSLAYHIIRERKAISRIELARETGMSATSMTRICSRLMEAGLIKEGALDSTPVGRKAVLLHACENAGYGLCIDIDIGVAKLALYDMLLNRLSYREITTDRDTRYNDLIDRAALLLHEMEDEAGISQEDVRHIGISSVGSIENGVMRYVSQFRWSDVEALSYAKRVFNCAVILENECKAALVGEHKMRFGVSAPDTIAYISLGKRGVGCAMIRKGKLLRGVNNAAGELGHTKMQPHGLVCDCARQGCLQTFLAGDFIMERAKRIDPGLKSMDALLRVIEEAEFSELRDMMHAYFCIALNLVACAYNPDIILVNDSYFAGFYYRRYMACKEDMGAYLFRPVLKGFTAKPALLDSWASLYGIGCMMQEEMLQSKLKALSVQA